MLTNFLIICNDFDLCFFNCYLLLYTFLITSFFFSTGIIVSGCPGTGKTALILQLVEYSCFSRKRNCEYEELREQSDIREMLPEELTIGMFTHLASHVVAYHFCQVRTKIIKSREQIMREPSKCFPVSTLQ